VAQTTSATRSPRSRRLGGGKLGLPLVLVILVVLPFLMSLLTGQPVDAGAPKFWQGLLIQVFIMAVYAMSYDLLFGYTGILSFGHAMFFGTGAYVAGIMLKEAHASLPVVILAVICVAVLQSLLVGVVSLRVRGVYFAMATLAFAQMFYILVQATDLRDITGAEDGLHGIPVPAWLSPTDHRLLFYFVALAFCVVVYLIARRVVDSPPGRVMVAIRENEPRAQMIGYNTFIYKLLALTFAGVLAALAGLMNSLFNGSATPEVLGVETTINALLMTIIGGVGTLIGPMLGAALVQLLGYWLNSVFGSQWQLIFGAVYVLLVVFLPYGIVGTYYARRNDIRGGWQRLTRPLHLSEKPVEHL
jgi:branched-chain amino acid transport system permease protein